MLKVLHLQVHTQEGENINVTNLMSVFEIIGSIAFAISGSMLAIKKEMDLFGILILGIVTSVGGGAIRDIVIGNTPPAMFQNPKCTVISSITAVVVFIIWKIHNRHAVTEKIARRTDIMYHNLLFLSDTLGLAAFTILGMETTIRFLNTDQFLLIAFVGLITAAEFCVICWPARFRMFCKNTSTPLHASSVLSDTIFCIISYRKMLQH